MSALLVVDAHPDPAPERFGHALAAAYAEGAAAGGHGVHALRLADVDVPVLRSSAAWHGPAPALIAQHQQALAAARHLVLIYPLWLGALPAHLKAWLEQVLRPGFALPVSSRGMHDGLLKGKSARIIMTCGMPGFIYRWYFGALTLRNLERNILKFVGFQSVRHTIIGNLEGRSQASRLKQLERVRALGRVAG